MTNEEAKDFLAVESCKRCRDYRNGGCYGLTACFMSKQRSVLALEKQIPKKPEESSDGYADGCAVIDYHCPNCGREIDETDHHCICGQAIDWSEEK